MRFLENEGVPQICGAPFFLQLMRRIIMSEAFNVAKIFGEDVFNDKVMRERLPKKVYKE